MARANLPCPTTRSCPTSDVVGTPTADAPFSLVYRLQNTSMKMVAVSAVIEGTEGIVFGGSKACSLKLLPLASHDLALRCVALAPGRLMLPRLALTVQGVKLGLKEPVLGRLTVTVLPSPTSSLLPAAAVLSQSLVL
jgi:hypothetical protein